MNPLANREVVIFNAALELPASRRGAYLQEACVDDPALRLHIEDLLRVHEQAGAFMETPARKAREFSGEAGVRGASISFAVAPSEKPGDRIGRYKLLHQIGEGGCGIVYMAEQEEPVRRRVALKVIKLGMDTRQVIGRFEAERQALALMDHPNIARVFDAGATEAGRPYFVMELVKGVPITRYCDENHLSAVERLGLFIQVCQAVQHAHQKGIIHRDIKPSNVLVTDHDELPVPKIIDFGIAKATTDQPLTDKTVCTALEQFIGTPAYMSPEQAQLGGLDIDTRSDIYSLGVLLYELLTGKTPFDAKELVAAGLDQMRRTIRESEPLRPSTRLDTMVEADLSQVAQHRRTDAPRLVHSIRGDLDWIVMKALEKDRNRRYATANGLMLDLERHLNNEPVMARPPSKLYQFRKLLARNKLVFAAAAGMAAALLAGTAVSTWQAVRAKHAGELATASSKTANEARSRLEKQTQALRLLDYVIEMNLAFRSCQESNFSQASRLLQGCRPAAGEADLRGFEWRYLYQLCRGNYERTVPKHIQVVGSMEFSPNGRLLATYCWDEKLRLWDLENSDAKPIFEVAKATGLGGFSAHGDKLIFGDGQGAIQCYDVAERRLVETITNSGQMVAWAARPQVVATFREGSGVEIWDLATSRRRFSLPGVQRRYLDFGWIDSLALDPEGKVLAVVEPREGPSGAASDRGIGLRDLTTGQDLGLLEDARQIRVLRFSPNGQRLAVGDGAGTVILWDLATRKSQHIDAYEKPVTALLFSPDGSELITGSSDGTIKRWDVGTGKESPSRWRGQVGAVTALAFSPDSQWLASGSRDSTIKLWRREPVEAAIEKRELHTKEYGNFAFSPDGKSMAAGFENKTVQILDAKTITTTAVLTGMLYVVAFTPDSRHLLTATPGKIGYWWDLKEKTSQRLPGYAGNIEGVYCVDLSPDGHLTALGLGDGTIELLDHESGKRVALLRGHSGPVKTLRFSFDGNTLVSGGSDRCVKLWDVKRRTLISAPEEQHKGAVCAAAISHDGKRLASACGYGTIKLWDPVNFTNSLTTIVCHESAMRTLDFSYDGATLASGGEDRVVKLWNVASLEGKSSQREVASFPLPDKVRLVQFSPDGNTLAIITDNGVLRLLRAVGLQQADAETRAIGE